MLGLIGIGFSGGYLLHAAMIQQHLKQIRNAKPYTVIEPSMLKGMDLTKEQKAAANTLLLEYEHKIEQAYQHFPHHRNRLLDTLHNRLLSLVANTQTKKMGSSSNLHELPIQTTDNLAAFWKQIGHTVDQFDSDFSLETVEDQLTIIYIPGSNDPFGKVYDKHKGKKIADKVQFIGGFKEMMKGWNPEQKKSHLQEAFQFRYGKDHFPILLDLESDIAQLLSIKGYTILKISKKDNKIIEQKSFGFNRMDFFKALKPYFKK